MPVSRACVKTQLLEPEFYAVGENTSQTTVLNYIEPKNFPSRTKTWSHKGTPRGKTKMQWRMLQNCHLSPGNTLEAEAVPCHSVPTPCALSRGSYSDVLMAQVDIKAEFGGGIRESFPSVGSHRVPPVFLEHTLGAAWQSSALTKHCATRQAVAQGVGKTFSSGIGPQLCRLRCSYGLCHPV